jgi:hypothetical protein
MLAAEKSGIDGPCPRPDHCGSATERCQHDGNPRVADVGHGNPKLNPGDQRSDDWRPEANTEEYSRAGANNLWNHRWGIGCPCKLDDPEANQ